MNTELTQINEEIKEASAKLADLQKKRKEIQNQYPDFDRHVIREALNLGIIDSNTHPCIAKIRRLIANDFKSSIAYHNFEATLIERHEALIATKTK